MRAFIILSLSVVSLSGCSSILSQRPPVVEDKLGRLGHEVVGTLATAPDYRVVYVRLDEHTELCAEPAAEIAAQFSSNLLTKLTGDKNSAPLTGEAQLGLSLGVRQLFIRSQGVQFYRDATFALCNFYMNASRTDYTPGTNMETVDSIARRKELNANYLSELQQIRMQAAQLIDKEIPTLRATIDSSAVPPAPTR